MLKLNRPLWYVAYSLARVAALARYRLVLDGPDGALEGPALVVGKHQSYWDVPFLAWGVRKSFARGYPCFEMGSFHGYRGLRHFMGLFERIGGFPVMRPKDLIRLKRIGGHSKPELTEIMRRVNEEAVETRREVLRRGYALCFFPEGTRDRARVTRMVSVHEIEDAHAHIREEKTDVAVVPIVPCYGRRPRRFIPFLARQTVTVRVLEPIPLEGLEPTDALARIRDALESNWTPEPA